MVRNMSPLRDYVYIDGKRLWRCCKSWVQKGTTWQDIETLYRVRDIHIENAERPIVVTFVYPIFIAR